MLARILQEPERGPKVKSLLEEYSHDKDALRSWTDNFIEFGSGAFPVLTTHVGPREGNKLPVSIKNLAGDELYALQIDPSLSAAELRASIAAKQPRGRKIFDLIGQNGQIMQDSSLVSAWASNEDA